MTVDLHGYPDDPEYESAKKLKEYFEKDDLLANDPSNRIIIIPSVQCYGQQPQDIDVVILGHLENYTIKIEERIIKIHDFCCVVEVKGHGSDHVKIEGTKVYVITKGEKREATHQSISQKHSLRKYFRSRRVEKLPWISNILFFPNLKRDDFEDEIPLMNLLFKDFELKDFWNLILNQSYNRNYSRSYYSSNLNYEHFETFCGMLTKKIKPTRLDKEKVNNICKKIIMEQKYGDKFGTQLLIFRGRGGTGKTYRLLNLAYKLYHENLDRVLILTYNHALIADIRRLFAIMNIKDGIDESIQIKTLHSFLYTFFYRIGIRTREDMDYENNYEQSKELIDAAMRFIADNPRKIDEMRMDFPDSLCWNYVMIDEAQDWPKGERDLLYALFPPENIVVADGYDQLIRGGACNWRGSPVVSDCQVISLAKSMRQKSNIVRFLNEFAKKINISNFNIEEQDSLHGGKVIIVVGDYNLKFHQRLIEDNRENKNENVDMLFCVPPNMVDKVTRNSSLYSRFHEWGFQVWDAANETTKKCYPTDVNQLRIVQYDSCRGLEGWISVNLEFDKLYKYKLESFIDGGQLDLRSVDERRKDFAASWLLIPLTRAIDTLVICIKDPDSYISKILKEIKDNSSDDVDIEWIC